MRLMTSPTKVSTNTKSGSLVRADHDCSYQRWQNDSKMDEKVLLAASPPQRHCKSRSINSSYLCKSEAIMSNKNLTVGSVVFLVTTLYNAKCDIMSLNLLILMPVLVHSRQN